MEKKVKKLSTREKTVLGLMRLGKKNNDIANFLDVNEKTVSTYIGRLKRKMLVPKELNAYAVVCEGIKLGYLE